MRNYRPATPDLLAIVGEYLASIEPKLDSGDRYQAIVCRYLLAMVEREITTSPIADLDEAALASAIRAGEHDADWDATFDAVLARTIERVRLAKPDQLAPEHSEG